MRKFLLLGLMAATAAGASAQTEPQLNKAVIKESPQQHKTVRTFKSLSADRIMTKVNGAKQLTPNAASRVKVPANRVATKASTKDGYILYENFSGWDGSDLTWAPNGWTVDHRGECNLDDTWGPGAASPYMPGPVDGDFYYGISYSMDEQDEWFISPEVKLGENMQLSYWVYFQPFFFFKTDNIDWDAYEYIGDKEVAYTLQILIQEEGEDWKVLRDYAEEYADWSAYDLLMEAPEALVKHTISLADYNDKTVKVAFRYVGSDGDAVFIDAIGIGLPSLEDVSYLPPTYSLYWGMDKDWTCLNRDIAIYPVYSPLTWINMSGEDATYSWDYSDPTTGETATSDDQYELNVTYVPNYTSEQTITNNFHTAPTLNATATGAAPASYTSACSVFQAGGKAEINFEDGSPFAPCLFQFGINEQDMTRVSVMDDSQGALSVPVFGHNEFTNTYWLNYSLNGEKPMDGNFSHLIGIANVFFPSTESSLVVNGISVYGWGRMSDDVELTATIYSLNSELSTDFNTFTVVARGTIKGSQVEYMYGDKNSKDYLYLPFKFDEPVAIKTTDETPAFAIMFEGFNSDKVEYFAPLQSARSDYFGQSFGYMLNEINLSGHVERDTYYSFKRMIYKEDNDYIQPTGGFAIGLDAEYPWLTTETEEIVFTNIETTVTVPLGSYYDGSQLTVEAPTGVSASVTGRYDKCVLTVSRSAAEVIVDGEITIKGTGVELSIPVKDSATTGISEITNDSADKTFYDLSGRKIDSPESGIYIVKYSDGKVSKVTVK